MIVLFEEVIAMFSRQTVLPARPAKREMPRERKRPKSGKPKAGCYFLGIDSSDNGWQRRREVWPRVSETRAS